MFGFFVTLHPRLNDIYCIPGRRIAEAEIYLLAAKVMDTSTLYKKLRAQ